MRFSSIGSLQFRGVSMEMFTAFGLAFGLKLAQWKVKRTRTWHIKWNFEGIIGIILGSSYILILLQIQGGGSS